MKCVENSHKKEFSATQKGLFSKPLNRGFKYNNNQVLSGGQS